MGLAALVLVLGLPLLAQSPAPQAALQELQVAAASEQRLRIPARLEGAFTFEVFLAGQRERVLVRPWNQRAADFAIVEPGPQGLAYLPTPAPTTVRGVVFGQPESRVVGALTADGFEGLISIDAGEPLTAITPLRRFVPGADRARHVIHTAADHLPGPWSCGVVDLGEPSDPAPASPDGTTLRVCEIAFDLDWPYLQRFGGNAASALSAAELVLAGVTLIYERDVDITYDLTRVVYRTSAAADPYTTTDAGVLLDQFRANWTANLSSIRRDVAHLFTGRSLNGTTIGIAFLSAICQSNAYGLSERYSTNLTRLVGLTAHELGHNWGASHCDTSADCRIMCASAGGCTRDETRFSPVTIGRITTFRNSRTCLSSPSAAAPAEFSSYVRDAKRIDPTSSNLGITRSGLSVTGDADRVAAVWSEAGTGGSTRQDIRVGVSFDEGLSYSRVRRVDLGDAPHAADSEAPRIVSPATANLVVAWLDRREATLRGGSTMDLLVNYSSDGGDTWQTTPQAINADTSGPNIATDCADPALVTSGGVVHAFWLESSAGSSFFAQDLRYARSTDNGRTFSPALRISNRQAGSSIPGHAHNDIDAPHVAIDGQRIAVAHIDNRNAIGGLNQDDVRVIVSLDGGLTWNDRNVESSPVGTASEPRAAWTSSGLVVTWLDDATGRPLVQVANSTNGGVSFSPERTLSTFAQSAAPTARAYAPRIAADGLGVVVTWSDDGDGSLFGGPGGLNLAEARYARSLNGGVTWIADQPIVRVGRPVIPEVELFAQNGVFHAWLVEGLANSQDLSWVSLRSTSNSWTNPRRVAHEPNGRDFSFDPAPGATPLAGLSISNSVVGAVYDLVLARSEPHGISARTPALRLLGAPTFGSNVRILMEGASGITSSQPYLVGLSLSGESPAIGLGPGLPLLHLVPDALFFTCVNDPGCLLFTSGSVSVAGIGIGQAFPWPIAPGGPDLTLVGVIIDTATGLPRDITLPLTIDG